MKCRFHYLVPVIAIVLVLAAGTTAAQMRGPADGAPGRHWGTERTSAVASLEPIGAVEGWGRVMVMDLASEDDVERVATVHLYGLAPEAVYTVVVDEITLATVFTDPLGDGWVRLGSRGYATEPISDDLPAAAELGSAEVLDAWLAPTLEGDFQILTNGGFNFGFRGLEYMERIELESDNPAVIRGVARVARNLEDVQIFESRACGLSAGEAYEVTVNGLTAGTVTADMVGHGSIVLTTDGVGDALPNNLQPIEDLRQVEWTTSGGITTSSGIVVLWGTFTGENMVGSGGGDGGGDNGGGNGGDNGGGNDGDNGGGNGGDNGGGNDGDNGGGNDGDNGGGNGGDNGGGNGGDNGGGGGCP